MPKLRDDLGRFQSEKDIKRFKVTVWKFCDGDGDIEEKLWEASLRDIEEIEERYRDEPGIEIQVEEGAS